MRLQSTISLMAGGPGSGCQGPSCGRKVTVYHGTTESGADSILKEGIKPILFKVWSTTDKASAMKYAVSNILLNSKFDEDLGENKLVAVVTIPDAEAAGFHQFKKHYATDQIIDKKHISKVEYYKAGDLGRNKLNATPVKVVNREG